MHARHEEDEALEAQAEACVGTGTVTATTIVTFAPLTEAEIAHYVSQYRPLDKAVAYGIQEWIGMIAVESIQGCYFNVMGLPVQRLYKALCNWR